MKRKYTVRSAQATDIIHASLISKTIELTNQNADNGICKRSASFLQQKILEGDAVIAVTKQNKWVGFIYLQKWNDDFVSCCALIVHARYRNEKIAWQLKQKAVDLAKRKYPNAKLFGLTTAAAVMKINSRLGYIPVTYDQITGDQNFWNACKTCPNYQILKSKGQRNCLCTAMLLERNTERDKAAAS